MGVFRLVQGENVGHDIGWIEGSFFDHPVQLRHIMDHRRLSQFRVILREKKSPSGKAL